MAFGALGCRKGQVQGEGAHRPAAPVSSSISIPDSLRAASDPDELARAFGASRRALGAGRLHAKSNVTVDGGTESETLYEEATVERAANGDLHARYENSRDQAREIIASAGLLWLRPGFGKFHRRPPVDPGEAERVAADIGGVLAADFDLVAPQAALADGGATKVGNRSARKVVLSLGATPGAREKLSGTRAWRDGAVVDKLAGEVLIDDSTGAVLGGKLEAQVTFQQNGQKKIMALSATEEMTELAGAVVVSVPDEADSVKSPGRAPDIEDREELLSGLAPPLRRGGASKP